jgi:hypothetical protein
LYGRKSYNASSALSGFRFPASGLQLPAPKSESWMFIAFEAVGRKKEI